MPDRDELFLEFMRQQLLEQQAGATHAPRGPNQFAQAGEQARQVLGTIGERSLHAIMAGMDSPVGRAGMEALERYTQSYMRPAALVSTLGGMERATRAGQAPPEGSHEQAMGLMRGVGAHLLGRPAEDLRGIDYEPGMVTGNELLDMGLEAILGPDFWVPGIGVMTLGAAPARTGGLGIAARNVLARTPDPSSAPGYARAFKQVADALGIPDELQPLLRHVFDPDRGDIVAARRAQPLTRPSIARIDRANAYMDRVVNRMTDADLDRWAARLRSGMDVEEFHRYVRLSDGQSFRIDHWYDTSPVRNMFQQALGPEMGDLATEMLFTVIAATSPRTRVRDNVSASVQLLRHVSNGLDLHDIARMTPEEFGRVAAGDPTLGARLTFDQAREGAAQPYVARLATEHPGATPADLLFHAGYAAGPEGYAARAPRPASAIGPPAIDQLHGMPQSHLGTLAREARLHGQKIGSFGVDLLHGAGLIRNLDGVVPLTIDSHNIRQTLELMNVPLGTPAQRRAFLRELGLENTPAFQRFVESRGLLAPGPDGRMRRMPADEVMIDLANQLYASAVADTPLYGVFEQLQLNVLDQLVQTGRLPAMDPHVFQARLWVGGGISNPADAAPVTQVVFDVLDTIGRQAGIHDPLDQIRYVFNNAEGTAGLLLETAHRTGHLADLGIQSGRDFGELLLAGAARVDSRATARDTARQHLAGDDPLQDATREIGGTPAWLDRVISPP